MELNISGWRHGDNKIKDSENFSIQINRFMVIVARASADRREEKPKFLANFVDWKFRISFTLAICRLAKTISGCIPAAAANFGPIFFLLYGEQEWIKYQKMRKITLNHQREREMAETKNSKKKQEWTMGRRRKKIFKDFSWHQKTTKYNLFLQNYQQFGIWYLHFSLLVGHENILSFVDRYLSVVVKLWKFVHDRVRPCLGSNSEKDFFFSASPLFLPDQCGQY